MLHFKTSLFRKGEDLWWYWSDQIRYWKKKEWGKENRQESYRSCQRNTVYLHITHYLITSSSSCQTLRAGREKESAKKKRVSQPADNPAGCVPIFGFQEVLEFLQVRYEWVGDIIMQRAHSAPSCSWFPVADDLLRHADTLHCDPADQTHIHWRIWIKENKIRIVTAALKRL